MIQHVTAGAAVGLLFAALSHMGRPTRWRGTALAAALPLALAATGELGVAAGPGWLPLAGLAAAAMLFVALQRPSVHVTLREKALLLLISAGGAYLCLPDTEAPLVAAGALAALLAFAAWPGTSAAVDASLALSFAWLVARGARGRPAAFVAGIACIAVLWALPLLLTARSGKPGLPTKIALVGLQAIATVAIARLAGLGSSVTEAAAKSVVGLAAVAAAAYTLLWTDSRLERRRRRPVAGSGSPP